MTTHRKDKNQQPSSTTQQKVRSLLQMTESSPPSIVGLQGEALERALRERASTSSPESPDGDQHGDQQGRAESLQQPGAEQDNTAAAPGSVRAVRPTTPVDTLALSSLQADFFCDSRTAMSDAAIADQILTCGIDVDASQRPAGVITQSRMPRQPDDSAADMETADIARGLESRLIQIRNLLLKELHSSFADLQSHQKMAWAEQQGILRSLSEELRPAISTDRIRPLAGAGTIAASGTAVRTTSTASMDAPTGKPISSLPAVDRAVAATSGSTASPEPRGSQSAASGLPSETAAKDTDLPLKSSGRSELQRDAGKPNGTRTWEDIRKELLSECEAREHGLSADDISYSPLRELIPAFHEPVFPLLSGESGTPSEKPVLPAAVPDEEFLGTIPDAVDPETLSDTQLRDVFREREGFLSLLISRFRSQQDSHTNLLTLEQLRELHAEMPADMARLITQSLRRLDELTKLGELEMAFERARIARLKNQLQQSRQQIEVRSRQLGLTLNDDGTLSTATVAHGKTSNRRWLTKLGLGH